MYSLGERFILEIEEEVLDLSVVGDVIINGSEYLIGEDEYGSNYVAYYDDLEDELTYIDDEDKAESILDNWKNEVYGNQDESSFWDDDEEYGFDPEEEEEEFFGLDEIDEDSDDLY